MKITITFPDGNTKKYDKNTTAKQVVEGISKGLAKETVVAKINNELKDLSHKIKEDSTIEFLKFKDYEAKQVFWHSTAHIMMQAIKRLYPEAKPTIGPPIEDGFYYDIDHAPFKEEDLEKIEKEMHNIVKEDLKIVRKEISIEDAKKLFKNNKYKLEILSDINEFDDVDENNGKVSIYQQGEFVDLCRGPHVESTSEIKAFKLTKMSGAYWRADQNNKQLQRIYGISFPSKKQLKKHLEKVEEAKKRDHRILGKQHDLFMTHEYSPGSPFFHPNGTILYNELQKLLREQYHIRDYQEVITPQLYNKELWETSGHWKHYKEDMFTLEVDGKPYGLKPMNCPGHVLMYKDKTRSYRDLPLKLADFSPLHRNELKGALGGITRVRKFCQDDAHVFTTKEGIQESIEKELELLDYLYKDVFGFEYEIWLSTKPEKAMGAQNLWDEAEQSLKEALQKKGVAYAINEGDGAFYGPKIDVMVKDSLDRDWQCATIQLDFQMPKKFEATYEGKDGNQHTPIMIHRALLGSIERFLGVITEHFAAKYPLWLSPYQLKVLTIADRHETYANRVKEELKKQGFRVDLDFRSESMSKKIRDAEVEQYNYILVVGDNEEKAQTVNVRCRSHGVLGELDLNKFKEKIIDEKYQRLILPKK